MSKRRYYNKPEVIKIPIDFYEMVKNSTKGCPYIFVWDGRDYVKENNILPFSEDLSRKEKIIKDYYVLQNIPTLSQRNIKLKLKEMEQEISWLDKFELITVEHSKEFKIGFTPTGKMVNYNPNPKLPFLCRDNKGNNCIKEVTNQNWNEPGSYYRAKPGDSLNLLFNNIECNNLKLIIVDPKEEYEEWLKYAVITHKQKCQSIHVYIHLSEKTEHIEIIHTREEFYPDIVDLTPYLPQIKKENKIRIKLEFTAHHKVAFVGIDTTPPIPIKKRVYKLSQAIHSSLGDVTNTLSKENNELTRLAPGEEIELKFPTPQPAKPGNKLSYVLVSRGYYVPVTKLVSLSRQSVIA